MAPALSSEHTAGQLFYANGFETRDGGEERLAEHVEGISEAPLQPRKRTVLLATSIKERSTKSPTVVKPPHPILKHGVHASMSGLEQKKKLVHFPEVAFIRKNLLLHSPIAVESDP